MLRALAKTHKALTPEQREYFYPLLAAAAFLNPALLLAPGAVAAGEAAADATKATARGLSNAFGWWRRRREARRNEIEYQKWLKEEKARKEAAERAKPTTKQLVEMAREVFRLDCEMINATELQPEDKAALINEKLDQLEATLRRILR